ncbi:MAG: metallophosphoesterase [Oscillospiraceae bacterium]
MIYFTGDIHGAVDGIADFINKIHPTMEDVIVLLGDVGANYYTGRRDNLLKAFLNDAGTVFLCIHGNHERRPTIIPGYVETEWHGGKAWVQPEYPNLILPGWRDLYAERTTLSCDRRRLQCGQVLPFKPRLGLVA